MSIFGVLQNIAVAKRVLSVEDPIVHPWIEPGRPAAFDAVVRLERALGRKLPRSFHELLSTHNGWNQFFQTVDLLSTDAMVESPQLSDARETLAIDKRELGAVWDDLVLDNAVVFGVSIKDGDLFLLNPDRVNSEGEWEVIWWHHEAVERRNTLEEFLGMLYELLERQRNRGSSRGS